MDVLKRCAAALVVAAMALALPAAAWAALGGDPQSVQRDQERLGGKLTQQAEAAYTRAEITTPEGAAVREYMSPAGQVFAVTWRGGPSPDLSTLLGSYFDEYLAARQNAKQSKLHSLHYSLVTTPNIVVQMGGPMRALSGMAYVPALMPPGVSLAEIR